MGSKQINGTTDSQIDARQPDRGDASSRTGSPDDAEATWKALFAFTTRRHLPILCCAIFACLADGAIQPINTIFVGRIFDAFTTFGGGTISSSLFRNKVSDNVVILVALSVAGWILSTIFLATWISFGELQARSARSQIFEGLLMKPLSFFDILPSGVQALSPRLQTWV